MNTGGSEEVSHMEGGEENVSFARTVTIRGRGRQMGQLAGERRRIGGESCFYMTSRVSAFQTSEILSRMS